MNRKKIYIYCLSVLLISYQTSMCMPMTTLAAPINPVSQIQNKTHGVYQADKKYMKWMKEYPNCIHETKEWTKINGKYQYPVTPYDKKWGIYMNEAERYVACQIPQEILDKLNTEELLDLVLECPQIIDISLNDSIKDGVKTLAQYFNGMNELLARKDCLNIVSQYYAKYSIPKKQQLDYDALLGDKKNPNYDAIVDNTVQFPMPQLVHI